MVDGASEGAQPLPVRHVGFAGAPLVQRRDEPVADGSPAQPGRRFRGGQRIHIDAKFAESRRVSGTGAGEIEMIVLDGALFEADLLETLVPYCRAGLQSDEYCVWVW